MNLIGPGNKTSIRLGMKTRQRIRIDRIPDYAQLGRAGELAELVDNIPPLPQILVRGLELLDQPDSSTVQLTELLGEDPALAARVLNTANSPVFGRGTSVTTLERAVAVLGLAQLKPVLVTACLDTLRQETTRAVMPEVRVLREEAWQNSVCTALAASRIAKELAFPYAEEAYLHGLLHDLGKLALIHMLPAQYVEAYASRGLYPGLIEAEADILGVAHPLLGAVVAHKWRFPIDTCEVIRLHHEPVALPRRDSTAEKAALVQMADLTAHYFGFGHRRNQPGLLEEIHACAVHLALGRGGLDRLFCHLTEDYAKRPGVA